MRKKIIGSICLFCLLFIGSANVGAQEQEDCKPKNCIRNANGCFDAPPGVVIHNSPAVTKHFIGSPSIIRCKDGSYLVSHDYFGDNARTITFVYRSYDKGQTWKRIAEIHGLYWATLLERTEGVYLIGSYRVGRGGYGTEIGRWR